MEVLLNLYRVEPLVCKEYMLKRPVIIPFHRGGRRLHIGFRVNIFIILI